LFPFVLVYNSQTKGIRLSINSASKSKKEVEVLLCCIKAEAISNMQIKDSVMHKNAEPVNHALLQVKTSRVPTKDSCVKSEMNELETI
jgi:hypothetical protein